MTDRDLLSQALDALRHSIPSRRPGEDAYCERGWSEHKAAITALREALAAPMPEPVAWLVEGWHDGKLIARIPHLSLEQAKSSAAVFSQHYPTTKTIPLYAAPPAAPAPAVPEGDVVVSWNEDGQIVAVTRQDREGRILSVIAESAAPVVPLTDERLQKHAMRAGDCPPGSMVVLLSSLRRMLSAAPVVPSQHIIGYVSPRELEPGPKHGSTVDVYREQMAGWVPVSAAPVVREPIIDEMDAVASKYAHKLALDLECVLSDYNGKWWDTAMQTIGEYRMAMNRIHERESPTHMGEPVLPKISSGVGK